MEAAHGRVWCAEADRPPDLHVNYAVDGWRQHADDRVWTPVDGDGAADDGGARAESLLPESVRDDGDVVIAFLFVRSESATEDGLDSERGEEVGRGERGRHTLRLILAPDDDVAEDRPGGERGKHGLAATVVLKVGRRDRRLVSSAEGSVDVH